MIFNFGENPTLDVIRMLMHYAIVQEKKSTQPQLSPTKKTVTDNNIVHNSTAVSTTVTSAVKATTKDGPRRLHVTNLPFKVRDNELRTMFEVHGVVLDAEIIYNERGSKGFGFVTMETVEAANKAKETLHGKEIDGRKIEVNNATPRSTPTKGALRPRNKIVVPTVQTNTQMNTGLNSAPTLQAQSFTGNWTPNGISSLTSPLPSTQFHMTPTQITSVGFNTTNSTPFTGLPGYPTPEQYAQYYNFVSTHQGPFRGSYQNIAGSFGNYRYQPY